MNVYLEIGSKKVFAGAEDWPGLIRAGKDEESALQALVAYAPRYAKIMKLEKVDFQPPQRVEDLKVVERLEGNATTDFGAPAVISKADAKPLSDEELARYEKILKASWKALEKAAQAAEGKELRKGPRGGGREVEGIVEHVSGANGGYLTSLGWKMPKIEGENWQKNLQEELEAVREGLRQSVKGEIPEKSPRGKQRWPARYFVRRTAWHVLDHVWEIEDRVIEG